MDKKEMISSIAFSEDNFSKSDSSISKKKLSKKMKIMTGNKNVSFIESIWAIPPIPKKHPSELIFADNVSIPKQR